MIAKNLSTTPTIALFLIISVTGVFLMLHVGGGSIKMLHEWLGIAFVVFAVLHASANWTLMKRYLGGMKGGIIGKMVLAAAAFSLMPGQVEKGNPVKSIFRQVMAAPLSTIAQLYGLEAGSLAGRLQAEGYTVSANDLSSMDIARQNNVPVERVLAVITAGENR